MLKTNILPIKYPPPSLVYCHIINPLAIIMAHPNTSDWFYSHYIQLCAPSKQRKYGEEDIEFLNFYPKYFSDYSSFFLKVHNLNESILKIEENQLIDLFIEWIDNRYYIQTFLNEGQVPGTSLNAHKIDVLNEQLVYGYDLNDRTFKITAFDTSENYSKIDLSFDDLVKNFFSEKTKELSKKSEWVSVGNEYGLLLYKFNENASYTFNLESIVLQLDEYLHGKNSAVRFSWLNTEKMDSVFGMNVYSSIISWLNLHESEYVDIRPLFGLWDHKKIMLDRIIYLTEKGYLDISKGYAEKYAEIVKASNTARTLVIKYNIARQKKILLSIINILDEMVEGEFNILSPILNELNSHLGCNPYT